MSFGVKSYPALTKYYVTYRMNFWGYSTISYFSPMIRYSSVGICNCGREAINEFKLLVREAHKRGIEVQSLAGMPFLFS